MTNNKDIDQKSEKEKTGKYIQRYEDTFDVKSLKNDLVTLIGKKTDVQRAEKKLSKG